MQNQKEIEKNKIGLIKIQKNNIERINNSTTSLTEQESLLEINSIIDNILNYIVQEEKKEQKLIEKLKSDIKKYRIEMDQQTLTLNRIHYMKRIEYAREILLMYIGEEAWKV